MHGYGQERGRRYVRALRVDVPSDSGDGDKKINFFKHPRTTDSRRLIAFCCQLLRDKQVPAQRLSSIAAKFNTLSQRSNSLRVQRTLSDLLAQFGQPGMATEAS